MHGNWIPPLKFKLAIYLTEPILCSSPTMETDRTEQKETTTFLRGEKRTLWRSDNGDVTPSENRASHFCPTFLGYLYLFHFHRGFELILGLWGHGPQMGSITLNYRVSLYYWWKLLIFGLELCSANTCLSCVFLCKPKLDLSALWFPISLRIRFAFGHFDVHPFPGMR